MKERPILFSAPMVRAILDGSKTQTRRAINPQPQMVTDKNIVPYDGPPEFLTRQLKCPYGQPGDRLWVREAWGLLDTDPKDGPDRATLFYRESNGNRRYQLWRPSIFMPRWASRINLEIVSVRVERLQDISQDDARAEGCEADLSGPWPIYPRDKFAELWTRIKGAESLAANPWVWVVEFRRIEK